MIVVPQAELNSVGSAMASSNELVCRLWVPPNPAHVLRALERVLAGAGAHPEVAKDLGLLSGDLETLRGLAADLRKLPNLGAPLADEHDKLFRAHGALRAFFDLVAAKGSISLSGDPDERARLLNLLPRADDRRRQRRSERASE